MASRAVPLESEVGEQPTRQSVAGDRSDYHLRSICCFSIFRNIWLNTPLFRGQLGTLGGNSPWGGISSPPSNFDRRVGEISPPLQNSTGGWGRFLPPLVGILPTHPSKY